MALGCKAGGGRAVPHGLGSLWAFGWEAIACLALFLLDVGFIASRLLVQPESRGDSETRSCLDL